MREDSLPEDSIPEEEVLRILGRDLQYDRFFHHVHHAALIGDDCWTTYTGNLSHASDSGIFEGISGMKNMQRL